MTTSSFEGAAGGEAGLQPASSRAAPTTPRQHLEPPRRRGGVGGSGDGGRSISRSQLYPAPHAFVIGGPPERRATAIMLRLRRVASHCKIVNLVRSGRKQPKRFTASA